MVKIKKYANVVERFLHGEKGQRFFNFAYSIGAAIVIWGALFKILHLPGGSTLLCIGMGTEIAMFILTAFDRPPKEYSWEDVFPQLDHHNAGEEPTVSYNPGYPSAVQGGVLINGGVQCGAPEARLATTPGTVQAPDGNASFSVESGAEFAPSVAGYTPATAHYGQPSSQDNLLGLTEEETEALRESVSKIASAGEQLESVAEISQATSNYLSQIQGMAEQMGRLQSTTQALNDVSDQLLKSYQAITGSKEGIGGSTDGYAQQMEDLTRNISGLNTIYSIQLKSISSQLESIDRVNRGLKDIRDMYEKSANQSSRYCEETEKMARYMKQLNSVYEKMLTAMTINMANPMMGNVNQSSPVANPFSNEKTND